MRSFDSRKCLAICTLLLATALAVHGASPKSAAVVKDVSLNRSGQSLEVKITATEETKFTYFELSKPHRLVVAFPGIQNSIGFKEKHVDASGVERIRTSLFTNGDVQATRVVFDLTERARYRLTNEGAGVVRVQFDGDAENPPS